MKFALIALVATVSATRFVVKTAGTSEAVPGTAAVDGSGKGQKTHA